MLRGLMTHWRDASPFWRTRTHPIDGLLSHAGENGIYAKCGGPELACAFWIMMNLLRYVVRNSDTWPALFRGDMRRVLEVRKRFPDPATREQVLWLIGGAELETVSSANFQAGAFAKATSGGMLRDFSGSTTARPSSRMWN